MKTIAAPAKRARGVYGRTAQRRLLLGAAIVCAGVAVWAAVHGGAGSVTGTGALGILAMGTLVALYGLTFIGRPATPAPAAQDLLVSSLAAVLLGMQIIAAIAGAPAEGALRFAILFGLLGFFAAALAESSRGAWVGLGVTTITGLAGGLFYLPINVPGFAVGEAMAYWALFVAAAAGSIRSLAGRDIAAQALRQELERRATSDTMTGVSNRAHIHLLAQNEFARARRYGEPYSCLMIEIDDYAGLSSTWGLRAADTVSQVLTGYCVVVMRHCDSFGRLSPARFLALLPETTGEGANILASRMCRDTAALDVAVDGKALNFTISIGAAALHALDRASGDILRRVAQALDDAVERGRNCAVLAAHPGVMEMDEVVRDSEEDPATAPDPAQSP